jgi:hypothetical protein
MKCLMTKILLILRYGQGVNILSSLKQNIFQYTFNSHCVYRKCKLFPHKGYICIMALASGEHLSYCCTTSRRYYLHMYLQVIQFIINRLI